MAKRRSGYAIVRDKYNELQKQYDEQARRIALLEGERTEAERRERLAKAETEQVRENARKEESRLAQTVVHVQNQLTWLYRRAPWVIRLWYCVHWGENNL